MRRKSTFGWPDSQHSSCHAVRVHFCRSCAPLLDPDGLLLTLRTQCIVVGPVGLGLVWKRLGVVWGNNATLAIISKVILGWTVFQMSVLMLLIVLRCIMYRKISLLEFRHPTHFIYIILLPLYFCLISAFIINWSTIVAEVFWYIGYGGMGLFMIYTFFRQTLHRIPLAQMSPAYLFGPLPMLLGVQLGPFAPPDVLFAGWAIATLWYLGLHVMLLGRWMHFGLPKPAERPAMWLLVAASCDSVLAYAVSSPNGFGEVSKVLFFLAVFQAMCLLVISKRIFYKSGFVPAWWMTTLPGAAFSSNWLAYGTAMNSYGIHIFGSIVAGFVTLWILLLYVLSVIWLFRRKYLPTTPYRPPVEKIPVE